MPISGDTPESKAAGLPDCGVLQGGGQAGPFRHSPGHGACHVRGTAACLGGVGRGQPREQMQEQPSQGLLLSSVTWILNVLLLSAYNDPSLELTLFSM